MNPFSFYYPLSFFWRKLHWIYLLFVDYRGIQLRYFSSNYFLNNFSLLGLLRLLLLMVQLQLLNHDHLSTECCRYISEEISSSSTVFPTNKASTNYFFQTPFLFFCFFRLFYLSARFFSLSFLTLKSSFIIYLPYFHISDCFFYFHGCWECWLPRISGYHVPHTSGIATKTTIFKERIFSVSNKSIN